MGHLDACCAAWVPKEDMPAAGLQPIAGNRGQHLFPQVVHDIRKLLDAKGFAAVPAAEPHLASPPAKVKPTAAFEMQPC